MSAARLGGPLLAAALLVSAGGTLAATFEPELAGAGPGIELVGSGTASYMFWDVYDAALYAPASATESTIRRGDVPMTLILEYHRDVGVDGIRKAAWKALDEQHDEEAREALRPKVEALHDAMRDVGDGDRYRLDWRPGQGSRTGGLTLALNGEVLFESDDPELARAYFGIWLGEPPLSGALREKLLARLN